MEKVVPQKSSFDVAEKLDKWHVVLAYVTAGISFATGILSGFQFTLPLLQKLVETWLPGAVFVLTVATGILHCLFTHQYQQAEAIRRDDFFDNAFGCLLGDNHSSGYFSNDRTSLGLKKVLLNVNENCFFSLDIIQHMLRRRIMFAFPLGLLLLAVVALNIGGHSFIMLALNLFLALDIVADLVRLYRLKLSLEEVHGSCKTILSSHALDNDNIQLQAAGSVIREIVRYETALSYASTMFDSKYFNIINSQKAKDWEAYKKRYLQ